MSMGMNSWSMKVCLSERLDKPQSDVMESDPQDSGSRSDSPISDSHTISEPSPVSFMSDNNTTSAATTTNTASDSGVVDAGPLTMHTSPKPERKRLSPDRDPIQ